jgi:superoxide dismutase, Cu-Zn family
MRTLALFLLARPLAACGGGDSGAADTAGTTTVDTAAAVSAGAGAGASAATATAGPSADVRDSAGRSLGTLTLTAAGGGITVSGHLTGLPPGEHGIHIHAVGQCQPPFESAGPHWNPTNRKHGTENPAGPHLGDMKNVRAGADSSAHVVVNTPAASLDSLVDADGASIVLHQKADDYKTDPSGDSGARIACGVVTRG